MSMLWRPNSSDQEELDAVTKWILLVTGFSGAAIAAAVYAYPSENPPFIVLVLIVMTIISKGRGQAKFVQMPWKTYFWFYCLLFILIPIYGFYKVGILSNELSAFDIIGIVFFWIGIAALYGYAYQREFISQKLWQAAFIIYMGIILVKYAIEILAMQSVSPAGIGWEYISIVLALPAYYAFGMYAFNRKLVMNRNDQRQIKFTFIKPFKEYNRNGVLALVYIGSGLTMIPLAQLGGPLGKFLGVLGFLILWGMAMKYFMRYMRDIYDAP